MKICKIVLKIRKGHLRIIFFLRSLFSVRNIYEIYTTLTEMTLLNLTHFLIITQVELCLKRYICKSKFYISYLLFFENPRRKNFINPTCLKYCTIINWNKKCQNIFFHTSLPCLRKVSSFWDTKKKCENKNFISFFPCAIGATGVKTVSCWTSDLHHFYFLNNRDT